MLSFILLLAIGFVSSALATSISPLPLNSLHRLFIRQSSGIDPSTLPPQCQPRCKVVTTAVTTCQNSIDPACACSLEIERGFVDCLNCLISVSPSRSFLNSEQEFVDQYVQLCNSYGSSLPSTTLSGVISSTSSGAAVTTITSLMHTTIVAPSVTVGGSTNIGLPSSTTAALPFPSSGSRNSAVRDSVHARNSIAAAVVAVAASAMFL